MAETSRRYHHGDLRSALINEAIATLDREPEAQLTLRGLAKVAGVSPMAPYAHFDDKDDLLDAVAIEGFNALASALNAAKAELDSAEKLERVLTALAGIYVTFGIDRPGLYRVMFGRTAKPLGHPVRDAGERAFHPLADVFASQGSDARQSAEIAWSFVHGLTLLVGTGFVPQDGLVERHIKAACKAFAPA